MVSTSIPSPVPWSTTVLVDPWSTAGFGHHAGGLGCDPSSGAAPAMFSHAEAASTTTAMTRPNTSAANPLAARNILGRLPACRGGEGLSRPADAPGVQHHQARIGSFSLVLPHVPAR